MMKKYKIFILFLIVMLNLTLILLIFYQITKSKQKEKAIIQLTDTIDNCTRLISENREKLIEKISQVQNYKVSNKILETKISDYSTRVSSLKSNIYPLSNINVSSGEVLLFRDCDGKNFYYKTSSFSKSGYYTKAPVWFVFKSTKSLRYVRVKVFWKRNIYEKTGYLDASGSIYVTGFGNNLYYGTFYVSGGIYFAKILTDDYYENYIAGTGTFTVN